MPEAMSYQGPTPLDREAARRLATMWVRETIGQAPYIEEIELEGNHWHAHVAAEHPKVVHDAGTGHPRGPLFYKFSDIAELRIEASTGQIVDKPSFWEVRGKIKDGLDEIHESVEKALTKVGATAFSRLPFGEHMHSPLMDILSWLLFEHELDLEGDAEVTESEDIDKIREYVTRLESVGLVRTEGRVVVPENDLVEIYGAQKADHERIRDALALFFARGYQDIDSVRQVIGPHLHLSRIIYEDSIEVGEVQPVSYASVHRRLTRDYYGKQKAFKLPRYLVQLSDVGLIEGSVEHGDQVYKPREETFRDVSREQSLLQPLTSRLVVES